MGGGEKIESEHLNLFMIFSLIYKPNKNKVMEAISYRVRVVIIKRVQTNRTIKRVQIEQIFYN